MCRPSADRTAVIHAGHGKDGFNWNLLASDIAAFTSAILNATSIAVAYGFIIAMPLSSTVGQGYLVASRLSEESRIPKQVLPMLPDVPKTI